MIITFLLVLLLLVMIVMAARDGAKPFFSDYLKASGFIIAVLLALFTWAPLVRGVR